MSKPPLPSYIADVPQPKSYVWVVALIIVLVSIAAIVYTYKQAEKKKRNEKK